MPENFQRVNGAAAVGAEMATLTTWVNDGKGGFTQGKLKVAPDQLPTVKAVWVQTKEKFTKMLMDAQGLQHIGYPAEDSVSKKAVDNIRRMAGDDEGCLGKTLNDCIARCDELIHQTEQTMQIYNIADTSAEIKFKL
ncbi:hypothetical protein [Kutzneria kofuensis]|uniref:Excreted virulence factor EspC (Type VII ESX diderm) n=1 Tax=Kutzneria kofuensis TaxID=103725 RepID=A0A7W9KDQ6_9PSEU|nr:hypothetical protein [Kutzneria kofuensis]MBB5890607.1 hypothetical protein [Kutzneria kofuensis]